MWPSSCAKTAATSSGESTRATSWSVYENGSPGQCKRICAHESLTGAKDKLRFVRQVRELGETIKSCLKLGTLLGGKRGRAQHKSIEVRQHGRAELYLRADRHALCDIPC